MDYHPIHGGVAILSVASCYRNRVKLRPCGRPVACATLSYHYLTFTIYHCRFFVDIDECAKDSSLCQFTCANTDGSYVCSCPVGYVLRSDKRTCTGKLMKRLLLYTSQFTFPSI